MPEVIFTGDVPPSTSTSSPTPTPKESKMDNQLDNQLDVEALQSIVVEVMVLMELLTTALEADTNGIIYL